MSEQKPTLDYAKARRSWRKRVIITLIVIVGLVVLFAAYVVWVWSSANWRGISAGTPMWS